MTEVIRELPRKKALKKVMKKNITSQMGYGPKAIAHLRRLIASGNTDFLRGKGESLEKALGPSACKRLTEFLAEEQTSH